MIAGVQIFQTLAPLVDNKVYPMAVSEHQIQDTPYIIYQIVSSVPEVTMDGITGHEFVRVQIDVYHEDIYQCTLLANKVINQINNNIKPSIYGGQDQLYDTSANLYRVLIEYEFWQTTPTA